MHRIPLLPTGLLIAILTGGHVVAQSLPDAPGRVKGRVLTADEAPAPLRGAHVWVRPDSGTAHSTASDREGLFDVETPGGRSWSLRITKAGYAPLELEAAALPEDGIIRMTRGAVVTGRVVDPLGTAVAGALLRLEPVCDPCTGPRGPAADPRATAVTDDLGEYRIGSLPEGTYAVFLAASDVARLAQQAAIAAPGVADPRRAPPAVATVRLRAGEESTLHLVHEDSEREVQGSRAFIEAFDPTAMAAALAALGTGNPPPARERPSPAAMVRGRVVGPGGGSVSAARVQLIPLDAAPARVVSTDRTGRYELTAVPGRYRLAVSKSGTATVEYGQQRAQQQGTTIVLREGLTLDGLDVTLPRGSVISGRVVDVHGEPLEGITVSVLRPAHAGGRQVLVPAGGAPPRVSDDRGQYRLFGLLPGTYYIVVSGPRAPDAANPAAGTSPAPLLARMLALDVPLPDGRSVDLSRTLRADETPVYFPGTHKLSEALPIHVEAEMDRHGADVVFTPFAGAAIRGAAVRADGSPAQGSVSLSVSHRSGAPAPPARVSSVGADGSFTFASVPPGDYVVRLVSTRPLQRSGSDARPQQSSAAGSIGVEYGTGFVTVTDATEVAVAVRTRPGERISGRMIIEGEASADPRQFQIEALPADPDRSFPDTPRLATPGASGSFALADLVGPQRFTLARAPQGWYLKSAVVHGRDAADAAVSFDALHTTGGDTVLVTVARGGSVSGRASGGDGRPLGAYTVVVFATDSARWHDRSGYVKRVRSQDNGAFTSAGLPPGEYWVAAVERMDGHTEWGDWLEPSYLAGLTVGARRVSVGEGQEVTTNLRAAR